MNQKLVNGHGPQMHVLKTTIDGKPAIKMTVYLVTPDGKPADIKGSTEFNTIDERDFYFEYGDFEKLLASFWDIFYSQLSSDIDFEFLNKELEVCLKKSL